VACGILHQGDYVKVVFSKTEMQFRGIQKSHPKSFGGVWLEVASGNKQMLGKLPFCGSC